VIVVKKAAEHRRTPKALRAKLSMTDFRFAKLLGCDTSSCRFLPEPHRQSAY
jgi:hypothetical protein